MPPGARPDVLGQAAAGISAWDSPRSCPGTTFFGGVHTAEKSRGLSSTQLGTRQGHVQGRLFSAVCIPRKKVAAYHPLSLGLAKVMFRDDFFPRCAYRGKKSRPIIHSGEAVRDGLTRLSESQMPVEARPRPSKASRKVARGGLRPSEAV